MLITRDYGCDVRDTAGNLLSSLDELGSRNVSLSAENFSPWKLLERLWGVQRWMGQCYWLSAAQETKIKVWSMYSPTSEGELKSIGMKYAFTINNSDE